jgi:hypothetical protein
MSTSGSRTALSIGLHADDGRVPASVAPPVLTHAAPSPAATPSGAPIGVRVTRLVRGSTRETNPSVRLATHTAPAP